MVLLKQHTLTLRTALLPFGILQPISVGITTGLVFWLIAVRKRRAQQSGGVCVSPVTFGGSIRVSASTQVNSKSVVRAFVEAINAKDWARLRAVLAPEFRRHSVAAGEPGVRSAEDLIAFLVAEYATFPDAHETLLDLVAEGDKVAARHLFHGTQLGPMGQFPPSEKLLEATYLAIYRIENGRIVEAWVEWDNLAGLKQLGYSAV
ncbi:MAG: ester cyclase [Kiritimatiellae bacterium]|nr:ester cyclase [Kiritimatiellia bacterium]